MKNLTKTSAGITKFDPSTARIRDKALDLVISEKRRISDWPALEAAIQQKLDEQAEFVAWWEGVVTDKGGRPGKKPITDRLSVSLRDAEAQTGITAMQVSRWRRYLAEREAYSAKLFGVAWKAAMSAKGNDTTALKWTGDPESYTPEKYVEAARAAMGAIDLDPASNRSAQKTIQASSWFGVKEDGLKQSWSGRVFLNPPYSHPEIAHFITKLCNEYAASNVKSAILLTNNNTDTDWWHQAARVSQAVCFTDGRINFNKPDGSVSQPTNGQNFFYFGPCSDRFVAEFKSFGLIMVKA